MKKVRALVECWAPSWSWAEGRRPREPKCSLQQPACHHGPKASALVRTDGAVVSLRSRFEACTITKRVAALVVETQALVYDFCETK